MMMEFIHTDLPEPVVPAMSIWGIFAMLPTMQEPPMSLPTAKEDFDFDLANSGESITSRSDTVVTARFGTSMPTMEIFPGTAAIRTPEAPKLRAISSAQPVSLLRRTPLSSSTSYRVTLGPRVTLMIWASMWKLSNVSFNRLEFSRISSVPSALLPAGGFKRLMGGKQYSAAGMPLFC